MIGRALAALAVFVATVGPAAAQVALAPYFTDHVVIQRGQPITVSGTAAPREKLTVMLSGETGRATADDEGNWRAELPALPAGGPYDLEVAGAGGSRALAKDVMLGDVWLCSGQSNMELPVRRGACDRDRLAALDHGVVGKSGRQRDLCR